MEKKNKTLSALNIVLTLIILMLIALIIIFVVVLSPMTVSGESMLNTLQDGERIWVLKTEENFERGDIIVFQRDGSNDNIVKRVIAVAGDTVKFDYEKGFIVNNEALDEPYIKDATYPWDYFNGSKQDLEVYKWLTTSGLTIKEGELFVLGDNRHVSFDSHRYGPIKINEIKGRVL